MKIERTVEKGVLHYDVELRESLKGYIPEHREKAINYYFNLRWSLYNRPSEVITSLKEDIVEIAFCSISSDRNFVILINNLNICWIY